MAFILIEGIDRSGKSSVAKYYRSQGYEVVHMSAPDKKYFNDKYVGPSYLDECVDMYMKYSGKDVVFDRTPYGELVWPDIYGRKPMLDLEDIEVLREMEDSNDAIRILMCDPDFDAHWKRCVENNEPLNRPQFNKAAAYYERLTSSHNFNLRCLGDFEEDIH